MKQRLLRTTLMLVLIFCSSAAWAEKQMYARLSGSTLTFYYDENKTEGDYLVSDRGWSESASTITNVIFDSSFAEARPTSTYNWFNDFENLQSIEGIANLNTSNVTSMSHMFADCRSLTSLDLSNFNTSNVTDMTNLFLDCNSLTSLDVSHRLAQRVTVVNDGTGRMSGDLPLGFAASLVEELALKERNSVGEGRYLGQCDVGDLLRHNNGEKGC